MKSILNITNGDCAVSVMQQANIEGEFLPWRDVLHDGPVPKELSLEQLSRVRAQFISDCDWGEFDDLNKSFIERDNTLKSFKNYKHVILWFEHDLYDQLQILQILDWFYHQEPHSVTLSMICAEQYLGPLAPEELLKLKKHQKPITTQQLKLANKAWQAFRSDTPLQLFALLKIDLTPLPFLKGAIIRLLEEYPSCLNGLSRTATQALDIIAKGEKNPAKIFGKNQQREERIYLGDWSFWAIINELLQANPALISLNNASTLKLPITKEQALSITKFGTKVLKGNQHYLNATTLDRCLGGTHLSPDNSWCWNASTQSITASSKH